ncbi:Dyp-type peroxidase [Varunaivibrio sulfuroxidans]|uniref:Putative iron-dependent peroxidase n=1 Tax=Varunaivibrio sulfuroxidans TaxID=1773489 RepID=A0A4R3JBK6_9PROT|nr:Dyp-type peroxidase [Varunaivibrio sulfuroxidans]TCS63409.1 putative iron-dependent peroxidase [Varunaivibrio sulfuroxidans]WES30445.1 Dyp-type peroxidase [Varunaivibrio sulfuroxidans]
MLAQEGIFAPTQPHQYALEYDRSGEADEATVFAALAALEAALSSARERKTGAVIAFGLNFYRAHAAAPAPEKGGAFAPILGTDGKSAPATQHDLLVWLQGPSRDVVFDAAKAIDAALDGAFRRALEVSGFVYHDSRDLTGFVDGSANPEGDLRVETALVPKDAPGGEGAFMITQKWVHHLSPFEALPVDEQERVIGRTKPDSIEFEGDAMPENAHVARADVDVDGAPQRLFRRSFPYGTLGEHGLYFLAFSADPDRFDLILRRMYGATADGTVDRLLDFSTPHSGSYWFAPSAPDLAALIARAD